MTTNRKRWLVWKDDNLAKWGRNPWVAATSRHWGWGYAGHGFPTHAEALTYADRMARTVEVVLPRESDHIQLTNQIRVYRHSNGGVSITKRARYSHVGIPKADLKPLALALLAHHYKQEDK